MPAAAEERWEARPIEDRDAKLKVVAAMFAAFARFDHDEFARHLTEDVEFRPSAFLTGKGEFHGREEVRENLRELAGQLDESGEAIRLHPVAFYLDRRDESKVLALGNLKIIRESGESFGTEVAYLHTMRGDKVAALRTWLDHKEGLSQLASPEEVTLPGAGPGS